MQIRITPAVKVLLIACLSLFVVQHVGDQFMGTHLTEMFGLVPSGFILEHRFWQIFTYSFLHGDVMHLALNLMMLVFIGGELEGTWGTPRFLRFYFFCSVLAGLLYLSLQMFVTGGLNTPMVGASGALYGLLMAYGLIFGERVLLFMMLFPMKAKYFVWILVGVEVFSTVFSRGGGLANVAHLGGMIAGFVYLWGRATFSVWKKRQGSALRQTSTKKRKIHPKHLKLVINNQNKVELEATDEDDDQPPTFH